MTTEPRPSPAGRIVGATVLIVAIVGAVWFGARGLADWVGDLLPGNGGSDSVAVDPGVEIDVEIPLGASAQRVGAVLVDAGIIGSATEFESEVRAMEAADQLKAGQYTLVSGSDYEELVAILVEGPIVDTFWVTVREGLRIEEVIGELAGSGEFTEAELTSALTSGSVESRFLQGPVAELSSWEGLLFPDTYEFAVGVAPSAALQLLATTMESRVDSLVWSSPPAAELTAYERIVAASLIESETRVDADRPNVASVIYNRLDLGMALQIDSTVIYAKGDHEGPVLLSDLEIDSPYNTYLYPGLPPTPIGAPGLAALTAVAEPAATDYLYYVLTSTDGTHSFTSDYDEFLRFKRQAQEDGVF